ncbi:putative inhibitor of apoptosis [Haliotis rubra]|uniref:putative inhibitor of apoptosis n=1 Tax=Haliotis rubra TaxID=36100 RepID=UPI001EE51C71|nr:putative inhibitor of apoptosis [Haliotis rubra]
MYHSEQNKVSSTDTTRTLSDTWAAREGGGASDESDSFTRRLGTYDDRWTGRKDRQILARAGFVFTGIGDKVECERCGLKLLNWTDTDDALHEHATRRTHCPFIVSLYRKLGQTPPPKHPKYQSLQARLDSFVDWPRRYVPKTPEELASAGFFYIGSADRVTCFQCGITLRDWEEEHDPVAEHQRYSEHCQFINKTDLNQLGVATRILEGTATNPQLLDTCIPSEANPHLNTPVRRHNEDVGGACQTRSGCAYSSDVLASLTRPDTEHSSFAARTLTFQGHHHSARGHHSEDGNEQPPLSMSTPNISPVTINSQRLAEENRRLKENRTCRVCQTEAASMLFLPCGHLVTCSDCAPKVSDCCVCGKTILGTVKTFLT